MVCKNSSRPYITPRVPSGTFKTSWRTGCPPAAPGLCSASHVPNTTASWVLIAESSLPGMIETIKRTQLNFSHPAGWAQGPALLCLPPPPLGNYPWSMCGPASAGNWAVDRCYLLLLGTSLLGAGGGPMTMTGMTYTSPHPLHSFRDRNFIP